MEVMPYRGEAIRRGDVVCFSRQGDPTMVVHRVVRINAKSVTTTGDNNPLEDHWILADEQVIGRVTAAWRGTRRRKILGGWLGCLLGQAMYNLHHLDRKIFRRLSTICHLHSTGGKLTPFLPASLRPRILCFQAEQKKHYFLFCGKSWWEGIWMPKVDGLSAVHSV